MFFEAINELLLCTRVVLAFSIAFLGVPLPPIPDAIPKPLQEPLRVVRDVVSSQLAEAVQNKRVLRGSIAFGVNDLFIEVPLGVSVDLSKSIVLVSQYSSQLGTPDQERVWCTFGDPSTLYCSRFNSSATLTAKYEVIEFTDGANVFTSQTSMGKTTCSKTITVSQPFTVGKSIPIVQTKATRAMSDNEDHQLLVSADLLTGNQITFTRGECGSSGAPVDIYYHIVEFASDVTVTKGTTNIPQNTGCASAISATVSPAITNLNKALLHFYLQSNGGGYQSSYYVQGSIVNTTTLNFQRNECSNGKNGPVDIIWYVAEFGSGNETYIQGQGSSVSMLSSEATKAATLSSLTTGRAFNLFSNRGGALGSTGGSTSTHVGAELTTATNLQFTRGAASGTQDISYFSVELPPLDVTSPDGGQLWRVGETQNITWKHALELESGGTCGGGGGGHKLKIELCTDGATCASPASISSDVCANLDTYAWTIPGKIGTTNVIGAANRIKITDLNLSTRNFDKTDANFDIKGTLSLTAPNGGETWYVGDTSRNILWDKNGDLISSTFSVRLSEDGGASYNTVIADDLAQGTYCTGDPADAVADSCTYNWNPIPDSIGSNRRVRVFLASDASGVVDDSSGNFTIKGILTITAPNGTESWPAQTSQNITWNKSGTFSTVSLYYSTNSGGSYPSTITTGTTAGTTSGSYAWTVPVAAISNFVRVKVESDQAADVQVNDASNADFVVVPSLRVSSPDTGAEVWRVGETQDIAWSLNGSIANVKIEYSTNAFTDDLQTTVITASTPADPPPTDSAGTYAWVIPDIIGDNVKVRVSDVAAPTTRFDVSDSAFKIRGRITVGVPNNGEVWPVGSSQVISWTKDGSFGNVDILYSTNGGATFPNTIATNVAGTTHTWNPIPDQIGNTVRVRIRANAAAYQTDTFDDSNANFAIKGSLTITSPNGSESWPAGTSKLITWDKTGTLGDVKLEYSTDGGSTYPNTIVSSTPSDTDPPTGANNGQYAWTVPGAADTDYRVKITLLSDTTVYDASNSNFTVTGSVNLTAPDGSEVWIVGASQNITWTHLGLTNVKLEYSTDGGATWPGSGLIAASVSAGALAYLWTIPDAISANVKVRISDANDASINDVSASAFIIKGALTLGSPNGGQAWVVGSTDNITWTKSGTLPNVKLEYSKNAFSDELQTFTITSATPGADLSYPWTIPDAIGTTTKVRVTYDTTPDTLDLADSSDANFTIKGSLTLIAPDGGEQWGITTSQVISWTKTGTLTGNVKLEYSTDGGASYPSGNLISNTVSVTGATGTCTPPSGGGCYEWSVPDAPTTQARVRITYLNDTSVNDQSNNDFSIKGSLTLNAPNGTETWLVGETRNITWTKGGSIANVKLDLSKDGGTTYPIAIVASTPASNQSYAWVVPDEIDTDLRVRVTDISDTTVLDTSNGNFTIKGSLTITAPNGGQTWIVGDSQNIVWNKTGTIANVKLEYSTNGFADELQTVTIVASAPGETDPPTGAGNGQYAWTVPDTIGTNVKVRITNLADATVLDVSDAAFTIKGSLTLSAPNGSETWIVSESRNIVWTMTGSIANVKLEYSKNGFADETQTFSIVASTTAETDPPSGTGSGQYAWTVSDAIGTSLKVRVSSTVDATVNDVSNATFTIKGKLTMTAPNNGEVWNVGSSQNITWTRNGSIAFVELRYSTDGGSTFPTVIVASTDADPLPSDNAGVYAWTIPDAISSTLRARITSTADASVFDDSDANFKIRGALTLNAPNGNEKWAIDSSQTVQWTRTGSVANVKLEYSTDGGTSFPNVIVASTEADPLPSDNVGTYAWTIPNSPSATVKVRVSDAADSTALDVSDGNFKIKADLTLTAPNTGEIWTVDSAQSITWTTTGTATNVKLEYSTDGGNTYPNTIVASTLNTGSFSWTVPDSISTSVRVKVTDAADSDAFDASDGNFKIRGALTLTAPNGGELWGIATEELVKWGVTGSIANVKLEYSTNAFADELQTTVITASTAANTDPPSGANNGQYSWTIPNSPSATVKVRLSDAADSTVLDLSNGNFSIRGSVTLTAPNGSEVWVVGATQNITWNVYGAIANVKLQYSIDGGVTWPVGNVIISSTPASTDPPVGADNGQYSWTIPDAIGTQLRVRVSDAGDASVFDDSNANFTIKGSVTVTAPNGGEVWVVGASQNIAWSKTGSFANVKLEYSKNAFADELQTVLISGSAPASPLNFAWTIPDAIGNALKVRVSDAADSTVVDVSNANFEIKGSLTLTSPNGSEIWKVGESRNITWTKTGTIATAKLEYSANGGTTYPNVIITSTDATSGIYAWTVPDSIGASVRVKITSTADATVNDASNASFEIKGSVTLTTPNGGEVWIVGATQDITWTRTGSFSFVKLEYSTNAFADELQTTVITTSTDADPLPADNAGTYAWTMPDAIGSSLRVRIINTADAAVVDASNANFKIRGALTLSAPNGGDLWTVGSSQNVTWTKVGSIANVKLEYSTDGGTSYPNIITISTSASTGAYAWTIPDAIGANRKVRILDASDSTVNDVSDANFTIMGGFTLSAPNGGEVWTVNSAQTISWSTAGSVTNVKLEYSTDGGSNYSNVITATSTNTGSYSWTAPDSITTLARVRVSDVSNADAFDVSNGNFKIRGALALTAPNGGEAWAINTTQNIAWTRTGSIANVKLEYSTNAFADETVTTVIVASTPADPAPADNAGTYAWLIPDAPSTSVKVRVSDASDVTVNDLSNASFSIKGSLTLSAPNGSEVWVVGNTQNITWTKFGAIANVQLQYSTDGGVTWPVGNVIISSTPADPPPTDNSGSYSWTIPDAIGTELRVRVSDVNDTSVFDDSNANFTIKGSVTVTAPNGSEVWIVGASQSLTWNKTGSFANVKLEYSKNGFADELETVVIVASAPSGTPATSGSYAWTIPDAIGNVLKVRVSDAANSTVVDTSNANFEIKGSLTLTSPNGSEIWKVGESRNITWTKTGSIANVKLEYSTNGGTSYANSITASTDATTGTYAWTVPDAIGTLLRVRITHTTDATVFDASDANFEIKGSVTLTAPDGSEVWRVGESRNITWTKTGSFSFVKLEYSKNAFADELQTTVITVSTDADPVPLDNAGTYAWTIPDAISNTVRVRITNTGDSAVIDSSNANFAIKGLVTLTAPNGGEVWVVGSAKTLTWTSAGSFPNVKLEYSTNAFADELQTVIITASTPNNGSYAWTVPDAIGTTIKVRSSDVNDAAVNDVSNTPFEIKSTIALTAPSGGEVWKVGESRNITWTKSGTIANVELRYSTDGGTSYPNVIVASTPGGSLSYAWTIPDAISNTVRVKITNLADSSVLDTSDSNFSIKGSLTLSSPNGSEIWLVGETRNVTWLRAGSIATVKLEYSTDGGSTYPNVITTSSDATTGSYAWTLPDAIGTQLRVRITNTADATVVDASDANFEIRGSITATAPNGSEIWTIGESHNITWIKQGTLTSVKLEYSTNAFADELQTSVIAGIVDATTGTPYAWTIPDAISNTVRVRVSSNQYASVFDVSDANFKIQGSVTLTAPNGDPDGAGLEVEERWTVGQAYTVTWTKVGSIANVKLEYSTDSGTSYPSVIIASTPAGTGAYSWTIPDSLGINRRVRVSDASDSTVLDTSNGNFTIMAGFTVTTPNGGEVWVVGSAQTLTWTTTGSVSSVKLEYSSDGGTTYPNVIAASTPNTGSYGWTVPDSITTLARVKVSDVANANAFDVSNGSFKIRGALILTAPNGGERWEIGTTQDIAWTRTGSIPNVKLEYSTNGFSDELETYVLTTSTPADPLPADNVGAYAWTIPNTPSIAVKVRLSDSTDSTVFDTSNANFTIAGRLTLNVPSGTQVWIVGATQNITWTRFGSIANVKLEYSTDGGLTWPVGNLITSSTPADPLPSDDEGSYSWTIPDAIGTQLRVRVSDAIDPAVSDSSSANFTIKGQIAVTAPNGSEVWVVGESRAITWTKQGSFANVKLQYSTNGFADELQTVVITSSTPNTGTFSWTVADAIGTSIKVRASDAADSTVSDISNASFTIKGSLTLSSPNGGEVWKVGESRNITWTKTGSIATVKLEYSINGGTSFANLITASTDATTGSYTWAIPDAIGTQLRVRITDTADATVLDSSDANFEIKGSVTLIAPNGSEVWVVDSTQNITWTRAGSFANVKLEYSTNAFTDELQTTLIMAATPADPLPTDNAGAYAWTIPDEIGSSRRVRITNTADAAVVDTSNANFKIVGSLSLTTPNGAESWTVGSSQNITWTKVGSIANVKLEYSTDGGASYPNVIVASSAAGSGAYSWMIPDSIGTNRRVRISDASDTTVNDVSNANFTIMGGFTLTAPNSGEVWTVGSAQTISWTTAGTVSNVKLELSSDGGSTYPTVIATSTPNTGTYGWIVSDVITTLARMRVSDVNNANAFDVSNANFKIRGAVALTAPNGAQRWEIGTTQNIAWTRTGSIPNVKIEYSTNGFADELQTIVLTSSTAADPLPADDAGTYAWTIPNTPSIAVKIRISDATDSTVFDLSNADFSIVGRLVLGVPNGAEVWLVGTTQNITWTRFGSIANVKLEYSTDGGVTWPVANLITSSTSADPLPADDEGSYSWTIPDAIGTALRVRVSDASDGSVSDASNADFTIKGQIAVTAPNGSEVWVVGESRAITWTKQGSFANVKLQYSTNGFADEIQTVVITSSTPNTGTFAWTVADAIGPSVKVRASDAADGSVSDISSANFTIKGSLTLTAPSGGEAWIVGEDRPVTWNRTGSIANVKLEYSTDGGATYPNVITLSTSAATGSYTWTIPDAIGTQLKVRVTDTSDASVNDVSDASFTVKGSVTVTSPNGGEAWVVGSTQNIAWTRTGSFANVKLEYSTNAFADELQAVVIAASTPADPAPADNAGNYSWLVPDAISSSLKVRVSNTADAAVQDRSDANFKIIGSFTLSSPNGGEEWVVGTNQDITWTKVGSIANARLSYTINGGVTYPLIISSTPAGSLTYTWTIPDAVSATAKVRISDVSDATIFDDSNADFRIRVAFTLTAPNGNEQWLIGNSYNITWAQVGTIPNVKLEYSTDSGTSFPSVIASAAPAGVGGGAYAWTIPDAISATVKMRVSDPNDAPANDVSNTNFKISPRFTLSAPSGGEQWIVGSSYNITWTKAGSVTNVKLEYSTNAFTNELQTALITSSTAADPLPTDNAGIYAWTIPDAISATVKIRISDVNDATANDVSDANFKIKAGFTLTAPNGGEVWTAAESRNVTWSFTGTVANVKLEYSTDSGTSYPSLITSSTSADPAPADNAGTYAWTIPDAIGTTLKVKVTSAADTDAFDVSDAVFKIRGALAITFPNGGEALGIASVQNIAWTRTGTIANVKLEYSRNGFADEALTSVIVASIPADTAPTDNAGTYAWTVPDTASPTVKIRVSDISDATVFDLSNANFSIVVNFTLTAPNGGEVWTVAESRNIAWTWGGTLASVKLAYSTDGGSTYPNVIAASTSNAGTYAWTVPDSISMTVRVRVEDPGNSDVFDASDANFKIQGKVVLLAPNGGERWVVGETRAISWVRTGSIANVKLEYSTDGGLNYPAGNVIIVSTAADPLPSDDAGSYSWVIPDNQSATARVRVSDFSDATVLDASDVDFTIDYYDVTWELRDLLSNNHVAGLSVNCSDGWVASAQSSPVTRGHQFGSWTCTWSHNDYADVGKSFVSDRDQTIVIYMESKVVHVWESISDLAYDSSNDTVTLSSTLRRDGITVSGPQSCAINIYDGATLIKNFTKTGGPDTPQGFYSFAWAAPTGLVSGKVYNVTTTIVNAAGGNITTPRTFQVTEIKKLQEIKDTVDAKLDKPLSQVENAILGPMQTKLDDQKTFIKGAMGFTDADLAAGKSMKGELTAQSNLIDQKTTEMKNAIQQKVDQMNTSIISLESAAGQSKAAADNLESTALQHSAKLLLPAEATTGLPLVIRWRAPTSNVSGGFSPKLKIENADNALVVDNASMVPVSGTTNLFEYVIDPVHAAIYTPGQNIVVSVEADVKTTSGATVKSLSVGNVFIKTPPGKILMKDTVKAGQTVSIKLIGAEKWTPYIELNAGNIPLTQPTPMRRASTDGKFVTFEFEVPKSIGDIVKVGTPITAIITEPLTGFFDQGTFTFSGTSLDDLAGQIAAQSGGSQASKEALRAINDVKGSLATGGNVSKALEVLKQKVERIPKAVVEEGTTVQMKNAIHEVAERVKALAGEEGYDLSELVSKGIEEAPTLKSIRKKTDKVQGATEVMQILMERKLGGIDAPVVHTVYE